MKIISYILLAFIFIGCSSDRTNRNPYLQEVGFRVDLNLNLPLYIRLKTTGSPVYVNSNIDGSSGFFVINTGFDQYRAFEANCPNHIINSCSVMTRNNSQVATCACEDFEYSLFTGQQLNRPDDGQRYYDMLEYNVRFASNTVSVSN